MRKILWIIFAGISIPISILAIPASFFMSHLDQFGLTPPDGMSTGFLVSASLGILLITIMLVGAICILIYNIIKYRLEKDDELFL